MYVLIIFFYIKKGGAWKHPAFQRYTLDTVAKKLGIKEVRLFKLVDQCAAIINPLLLLKTLQMSDWYSITRKELMDAGGRGLITHFKSLPSALMAVYKEYDWEPSKFYNVKKVKLKHDQYDMNARIEQLKAVEKQLEIINVLVPSLFSMSTY